MRSLLELLKPESSDARLKYYRRCVQKEHLHDYHYPNPLGPPNILQPCAQLLKGTNNMVHCKNNYPRELVCEQCSENIAQDCESEHVSQLPCDESSYAVGDVRDAKQYRCLSDSYGGAV